MCVCARAIYTIYVNVCVYIISILYLFIYTNGKILSPPKVSHPTIRTTHFGYYTGGCTVLEGCVGAIHQSPWRVHVLLSIDSRRNGWPRIRRAETEILDIQLKTV